MTNPSLPSPPSSQKQAWGPVREQGFRWETRKLLLMHCFQVEGGREGRKHSGSRENPYTFFFPPITTSKNVCDEFCVPH